MSDENEDLFMHLGAFIRGIDEKTRTGNIESRRKWRKIAINADENFFRTAEAIGMSDDEATEAFERHVGDAA